MGNCNCFRISQPLSSFENNDVILEEDIISKPYNNDNNTTNGITFKISPRGGNNPTQNNIIKNINKSKSESDKSISEMENLDKIKPKKISYNKLEDTTDKEHFGTLINDQTKMNEKLNAKIPIVNKRLTEILKLKDLSKNKKELKNSINIIFLGDKCVGKTSIVYQFTSNKFEQYYIQTIMREEFVKIVPFSDKKYQIKLTVTSGVPQYQEDYSNFYVTSDFFIVCYDVTSQQSFEKAKDIINKDLLPYVFLYNENYANVILLGNKSDVKERQVNYEKVLEYCKKYKFDFYEVSAKLNTNIPKVFSHLVEVYDEAMSNCL